MHTNAVMILWAFGVFELKSRGNLKQGLPQTRTTCIKSHSFFVPRWAEVKLHLEPFFAYFIG